MEKNLTYYLFLVCVLFCTSIGAKAQSVTYNVDEVTTLKAFFRQVSADKTTTNGEKLGVNNIDNWNPETEKAQLEWNNETPKRLKFILWNGCKISGRLDITTCTSLESVECSNSEINEIIFSEEMPALIKLFASNCKLQNLIMPRTAPKLTSIFCSNNSLSTLELSDKMTKLSIVMVNGNQLRYSTLPHLSADVEMAYSPQDTILFKEFEGTIDLSSEYRLEIDGNEYLTTYEWALLEDNGTLVPLEEQSEYVEESNGHFIFHPKFAYKRLFCTMHNDYFPELTQMALVSAPAPIYDSKDVEAMKAFFRQTAKDGEQTNGDILGVTDIDNWNPSIQEANLIWNNASPKRLTIIGWVMKEIAGTLDLRNSEYIERLETNRTRIKEIIFPDETPNLKWIFCPESEMTSLVLPRKAPLLETVDCYVNKLTELILPDEAGKKLEVKAERNQIKSFTIPESIKNNLYLLWLHDNLLTEINIPDALPAIRYFYLRDNNLTQCNLPENIQSLEHFWIERNKMRFSTLPKAMIPKNYPYSPQDTILINNVTGNEINLSAEYSVVRNNIEKYTEYEWFEVANNNEVSIPQENYTNEAGKFTFNPTLAGKHLICKMANENFPGLTLICEVNSSSADIEQGKHTSKALTLYPNPATDHVTIKLDAFHEDKVNITICNIAGQPVVQETAFTKNGNHIIPLAKVTSGIYLVKAFTTNQIMTEKLTVK